MFLGGSPSSTNIVNHWVTMNGTFVNKDNVFVVVHPKNVGDDICVAFKAIFKAENIKIIPGDYEVSISSKGISHFSGESVEYYIAVESNSTF